MPPDPPRSSALRASHTFLTFLTPYKPKTLASMPYSFPPDQLKAMNISDAGTFLDTSEGWPSLFVFEDNICRLYSRPLSTAKLHPVAKADSVIYSNLNPFKEVVVKVKKCRSSTC